MYDEHETALMTLERAKKHIERGWCQKAYAVDAHGAPTLNHFPEARCWCAVGALRRACSEFGLDALDSTPAIKQLAQHIESEEVSDTDAVLEWNDVEGRTQQEVLDLFDRAIQRLKEQIDA